MGSGEWEAVAECQTLASCILHVTWNVWNVIYNCSVSNVWLEQHYQNVLLERAHTQSKAAFDWAPLSTEYVEVETVEQLNEFPVKHFVLAVDF